MEWEVQYGMEMLVRQGVILMADAMVLVTVMVKLVSLYSVTNYLRILWEYRIQQQITMITSMSKDNQSSMMIDLI